jgi:hypothetical protein
LKVYQLPVAVASIVSHASADCSTSTSAPRDQPFPRLWPIGGTERAPDAIRNAPLEHIVAFKEDADTQYKFDRFWQWALKLARSALPKHEFQDESTGSLPTTRIT